MKQVLESGTSFLESKGVEKPRLAVELLAARLLDCKRLDLYLRYDTVLPETHLEAMRRGVKRVSAGEPVQYVLGQAVFLDHVF
ncbi:MAG: peptide chain release factor N(5)-glutamine methyltransferase, partial [Lentisphaerae bacterium]|nr:peptide chain release factor N(5)-glutamine methyltransferase [Lentisphaerota bacterium]